jgi:ubiquinone/menaquinone biosynthesis C-methylase UbiE
VLDISTGTGNSLFRHGWMKLDAEYTGLDLSETMLSQCQNFMTKEKVPVDLVIGDATALPFTNNYFDIVLNYGAINGYSDIRKALQEMKRVVKDDGLILFLDEQLYSTASFIEKIYFKKVLSSHNVIHHCPTELLPPDIGTVNVYQVYEFYYICTCTA